jgi:hypothetical protein
VETDEGDHHFLADRSDLRSWDSIRDAERGSNAIRSECPCSNISTNKRRCTCCAGQICTIESEPDLQNASKMALAAGVRRAFRLLDG